GLCMGFLGAREREHLARQQFLEKITGLLQFDHGLAESIRQVLGELALTFECEQACLAVLDDELERLFVWKVRPAERDTGIAETLAKPGADVFFFCCMETTFAWDVQH